MRKSERRRSQIGAAAVEFALVVPILIVLLFGITTAGLSYSQALGMANGTREGSRFGATTIVATTSPPYTQTQWETWADQVITRTRASMTDASSASTSVCVQIFKNSGAVDAVPTNVLPTARCNIPSGAPTTGNPPTPPTVAASSCVVAVWSVRRGDINALLYRFSPVIQRESIARYERSC